MYSDFSVQQHAHECREVVDSDACNKCGYITVCTVVKSTVEVVFQLFILFVLPSVETQSLDFCSKSILRLSLLQGAGWWSSVRLSVIMLLFFFFHIKDTFISDNCDFS